MGRKSQRELGRRGLGAGRVFGPTRLWALVFSSDPGRVVPGTGGVFDGETHWHAELEVIRTFGGCRNNGWECVPLTDELAGQVEVAS